MWPFSFNAYLYPSFFIYYSSISQSFHSSCPFLLLFLVLVPYSLSIPSLPFLPSDSFFFLHDFMPPLLLFFPAHLFPPSIHPFLYLILFHHLFCFCSSHLYSFLLSPILHPPILFSHSFPSLPSALPTSSLHLLLSFFFSTLPPLTFSHSFHPLN